MRKTIPCLITVFLLFILTGCWNNRDLSEMDIATALGLDRTEDGKIMVSVQIINPAAARFSGNEGGGSGGGGGKKTFVTVSNTGDTVFSALRDMLSRVNRKIFLSSTQIIIIGEDAARSGIKDIMDFMMRDHKMQFKTLVGVAKGTTARAILDQEFDLSNVPGLFIKETFDNTSARAFTKEMMLIQVARELVTEGRDLSIGTVEKTGKTTGSEGMAVFSEDKMVGWMDKLETRGYLFVAGEVKSTIVEIENSINPGKMVAVEIQSSSSDTSVEWGEDGKPGFKVEIKVKGNIGEQADGGGIKEDEFIKIASQKCSKEIKKEILATIKMCQEEHKTDIYGFGASVFDEKPDYWKTISDKWNSEIFPDVRITVHVETKLLRSGLLRKSIKVK